MNVKFKSIAGRGDLADERVVLNVLAETDIGRFIVLRTKRHQDLATTGVRNAFWFPDKKVSAGDIVVLYSKAGTQSEKTLDSGSKAHFFYWGQTTPLWGASDVAGVVATTPEWNLFLPERQ